MVVVVVAQPLLLLVGDRVLVLTVQAAQGLTARPIRVVKVATAQQMEAVLTFQVAAVALVQLVVMQPQQLAEMAAQDFRHLLLVQPYLAVAVAEDMPQMVLAQELQVLAVALVMTLLGLTARHLLAEAAEDRQLQTVMEDLAS
jgi:hypothetical protein